jgi:hypothetical protein
MLSEDEHEMISNLTRSIALDVIDMMETLSRWGAPIVNTKPDHYCAYETDDESEELIIRVSPARSISIKVSMRDADYGKDRIRSDSGASEEYLQEKLDAFLDTILKRGNSDSA